MAKKAIFASIEAAAKLTKMPKQNAFDDKSAEYAITKAFQQIGW